MQSMRVLSLSLSNGVGILNALHSCKDVIRNSLFQKFISNVEEQVEEGDGISAGFSNISFIPHVVQQMITTGEESGNLPKLMARLADFYEREISVRLQTFSRLAEPVMLLVMGVVVGLLVSSLILPIFKLSRAVG
jgi:type II secretory pathway component PulF